MAKRKITIDDLARMVKEGFDETATKQEVRTGFQAVTDWQKWAARRFMLIDNDLRAIRKQLTGVVYRHEFEKLETRVKDIENLLAVVTKRR